MMKNIILTFIVIGFSLNSIAQTEATTKDGRKVILNEDGTYTWVDTKVDEKETVTVEDSKETSLEGIFVAKHIDDMNDKIYYYPSKTLICQDKAIGVGFSVSFSIKGNTDNEIEINGISVKVIGLECVEKTELLFLFEDNSKLSITSWNEFNCKGNAWYQLSSKQISELSTKEIKKIRVTNGRNYKSYTHEIENDDKNYFLGLSKCIEEKDVRLKQFED
jgi:hypothetical protein